MILLNPKKISGTFSDDRTQEVMDKVVEFFETKGKTQLMQDYFKFEFYTDFIEFVGKERIFATISTHQSDGAEDCRWDTFRNCGFAELLGFYGLPYWYTWQVSVLGLGPIWQTKNKKIRQEAAQLLENGAIFAFGLSEKEHGADIYSSDMVVTAKGDGSYVANGGKYYIGNANKAGMVSTFGKMADTGEYVFFIAKPEHPNYELVKNVVASQNYVAEYKLHDYPITDDDILAKGPDAWDMALNTINIGKYNLGWASIGICTHALYEAITHASRRKLYNMFVTDFSHVKRLFVDSYTRLVAMKLFAWRASDYMRTASLEDRRYLLFNPIVKMKVTTQGEEVINQLWDVIAAKGFEKDMFFSQAAIDIRALPKLEGTVHVNIALILKFMPNYLFAPSQYPEIGTIDEPVNDDFLFHQGSTKGLGKTTFHDYNKAYNSYDLPNVNVFKEQIQVYKEMMMAARPDPEQMKDIDFLLTGGELFTLIVYGHLILENAKIKEIDDDLVDQIFDFMVRDFSKFAVELHNKRNSTDAQMKYCMRMVRKPVVDETKYTKVWNEVHSLSGKYAMNL